MGKTQTLRNTPRRDASIPESSRWLSCMLLKRAFVWRTADDAFLEGAVIRVVAGHLGFSRLVVLQLYPIIVVAPSANPRNANSNWRPLSKPLARTTQRFWCTPAATSHVRKSQADLGFATVTLQPGTVGLLHSRGSVQRHKTGSKIGPLFPLPQNS